MTDERAATLRARTQPRRNDQMQSVIAYEGWPFRRGGEFANRRFQPPHDGVPVQVNYPIRLAPADFLRRRGLRRRPTMGWGSGAEVEYTGCSEIASCFASFSTVGAAAGFSMVASNARPASVIRQPSAFADDQRLTENI